MTASFGGPLHDPPKPASDHTEVAAKITAAGATVEKTDVLLDKIKSVNQYVEALKEIGDVISDVRKLSHVVRWMLTPLPDPSCHWGVHWCIEFILRGEYMFRIMHMGSRDTGMQKAGRMSGCCR